jgi:tetratricopeptide (TPR) repeat protein
MLLNPYIAGNPLKDKTAFFGREDILREVSQMLNHPDEKAIVLYGQRRIGKTTILLQIDQRLTDEAKFTPVYFDLQDRASTPLGDVVYKLAQAIALRVKKPLPSAEKFDEEGAYFKKDFLPEMIQFAAPGGLVILFDEFDVMDSPQNNVAGKAFFPYLRTFISDLNHVKFVFVIGRRPEELSAETLSTFKGIRATRVSLLSHDATESVIRQSESKKSLNWSREAFEQVWKWTQGHTYFTQLMCNVIWEHLQEKAKDSLPPTVALENVDTSVQEALKHGSNAFHWIWDGLPPAERVVMAAMAESELEVISQDQIEEILNRSGVRLIARELKIAPMTLIDWELLHPVDNNFRFAVPLLRQWVKNNRPLIRVKEELDRLDPLAENLFRSGQSFYGLGKVPEAIQQLRQAINANPNHLKSRLLLGRILLEQGNPEAIGEAVQVLDDAYKYDEIAVEADLVKTLLAYADTKVNDDQKLTIYDHILEIQPNQPIAHERRISIWRTKGDIALQKGDFVAALKAYGEAGDAKKIASVRETEQQRWRDAAEAALQENNLSKALELFKLAGDESQVKYVSELTDKRWVDDQLLKGSQAEKQEAWDHAIQIYTSILDRFPDHDRAVQLTKKAEQEAYLSRSYKQAVEYLNMKQGENAKPLLVEIIKIQPDYKEAARYLHEVVEGMHSPSKSSSGSKRVLLYVSSIFASCLVWVLAFGVLGGITIWIMSLFTNNNSFTNNSSLVGGIVIVGFILALILATIFAVLVGVRVFNNQAKKRKR